MSRVLVYQANGVQGAATARLVQQAGYTTRVLIRDATKGGIFASRGMEVAIADLHDRAALQEAHESVDHVLLQIPAYADDFVTRAIDNAAFAMESNAVAGVIVKMANPTPAQFVANSGFSTNALVLERLRASRIPFSVVEPTMYLDTFLKPGLRHEIAHGLIDFPVPETLRVAWTTANDAARMAVLLLQQGSFGSTLRCAGAVAYDGHELASVFSDFIGKTIRYRSTPVETFQREIESAIGAAAAAPAVSKFRFIARYPQEAENMFSRAAESDRVPANFMPTSVRTGYAATPRRSTHEARHATHPLVAARTDLQRARGRLHASRHRLHHCQKGGRQALRRARIRRARRRLVLRRHPRPRFHAVSRRFAHGAP